MLTVQPQCECGPHFEGKRTAPRHTQRHFSVIQPVIDARSGRRHLHRLPVLNTVANSACPLLPYLNAPLGSPDRSSDPIPPSLSDPVEPSTDAQFIGNPNRFAGR